MKKIITIISFKFLALYIKYIRKLTYSSLRLSFSQWGEDIIIKNIFLLKKISNPTYLDIGCNHPYYINNTLLLHLAGSTGINVDANPNLIKKFDFSRPKDINLNIGINDFESELDFYIMKDNTLSTFSVEELNLMKSKGKELEEVKKVKLIPIQDVLNQYANGYFPDFLNLDVEGLDFQILKSIDFEKSSPKVICVEASEFSPTGNGKRKSELIDFLISKGYFEFAYTNLNAIMVKTEFWNS